MKIAFVVPYFGSWPVWFPAFLQSCRKNPSINWVFFTDCVLPDTHYPNIVFYQSTLIEIKEKLKKELGFEPALETPYKLCDFIPMYGSIFKDHLRGFDFWGHCDIDIIWGDIQKYITENILNNHDIFSTRKGNIAGHCTLFRNVESINQIFRKDTEFIEIAKKREHFAFDEDRMTCLVEKLAQSGSIKVYWPEFLLNYSKPKTNAPSKLPKYVNKYLWKNGKLFEYTTGSPQEILYLHFMTWKKTMTTCEFGYDDDPEKFYISYSHVSLQPISEAGSL
jgi:hypothetical protein